MPEMNCMRAFPDSNISFARKLGSEFVGTFMMVFTAAAAPIVNQSNFGPTATPATVMANGAAAGLAVLAVILATGHISGAHINPAVTLAFASLGHFPWAHVVPYAVVQSLGSISAGFALKAVYEPYANGGVTVPTIAHGYAFAHEFIITFLLMFVVMAVSTDTRAVGGLAAIAVSGTVLLNNLVAGVTTGASMNPVRTLGPAVASGNYRGVWVYMLAPPFGALAGAAAYTALKLSDKTSTSNNQVYNNDCSSHDGNASSRYERPSLENGLMMV